ncbi:MAG: hypothetical protein MRK02_02345 [Candidatus Scalindua sp.]|nr:hypothetical protein [Candidatus Scalindua sp.]
MGKACFDLAANIGHMVPDFKLGVQGMSSPEVTGSFGGSNVGQALQVYSKMYSLLATISSHWANMAGIKAGYERREEEWDFQAQLAEKELEQIGRQIVAAEIRVSIAEKDLANQELQIELAEEEDVFLQQKFTNQQLYSRMVSQISTAYFQTYQMAYDLAKQAERAFHHELGVENTNFIEFGYWDNLIKGLHSGDRLLKDLRRMELAYIAQNRREYELTQHFSLVLLNPRSLLDLKEKGKCEFHIPELAFDIAYPGQYMRRIKSVSLTIPCVTGPYVNISARLTLHNNRVRIRSNATEPYAFQVAEDNRFRHDLIGTQSIATSSGQNDSGLFELNFREERYLPFEGAGAISTWSLSLPEQFRQFDYESITDVIVTINYTAREGGDALRTAVNNHISSTINNWLDEVTASGNGLLRMFSMKREFSPALHKLQHPLQDSTPTTEIKIEHRHFPYFLHEREISVAEVIVILKPKDGQLLNTDNFDLRLNDLEGTDWIESSIADPDRASKPQEKSFSMVETIESEGNTWTFTINQGELPQVEDIWLLVRYTLNS